MSKIIQVLEQMANDASLQNEQAIAQLLATTDVNTEQAEAITNKDITSLERQLDVCPDIYCLLVPAEDDEPAEDDSEENQTDIKSIVNA